MGGSQPMNYPSSSPGNYGDFPMGGGPEGGPMGPMGPSAMGPVMNGGDGLDGMKSSPANGGPGTPLEDAGGSGGMGDYNLGGFGGPNENVSMTGSFFGSLTGSWVLKGNEKEKETNQTH